MSLIGRRAAVVSLGASCQTARQIRLHAALLAKLIGDPTLAPQSLPLDWIFAPPDAAARLVAASTRVPEAKGELVQAQQPFWPREGVWFWHDPIETEADFAAMQERQRRRWARFDALAALEHRLFVLSVTQNNLPRVANAAPQPMDFALSAARIRDVVAAVAARFPQGRNAFLFVTYQDRAQPDAEGAGWPLAVLTPDATDHEGDDPQWAAAFSRHVAPLAG